jgi:beta-N-acetylhexosaminidase
MTEASRTLAGSVLGVGIPGASLDGDTRRRLEELAPAGVILFARNVEDSGQVAALTTRLRDTMDLPLVLVDQEGGRVDRLRSWRGRTPSARELAAKGPSAVAEEARKTAGDLAALGFNVNCVPVLDLDEGNEANGIGDRSFGADPDVVVACARAVIDAHRAAGLATTAKHFPGLGRTGADTHLLRPSLDRAVGELLERELVPFVRLLDECPAVMVSHVALPRVTGSDVPASLSHEVITRLLRERLGYDGVVVSDDLAMGAVADRLPGTQAVTAIAAGCDLLLSCMDMDAALVARDALAAEALRSEIFAMRLEDASRRVTRLRHQLAQGLAG